MNMAVSIPAQDAQTGGWLTTMSTLQYINTLESPTFDTEA